jgi:uncharacterized protein
MKLGNKLFLTLLILCTALLSIWIKPIFAFTVPNYDGPVNDFADIISPSTETSLEAQLTDEANKELGVEIAVLTLPSLENEPIEDVAQLVFDSWQIGKSRADNGVLLLIAVGDREIRIQTGYGAEVFLPDAAAGDIMRSVINPQLAAGNYDQAVEQGVNAILERSRRVDQNEIARAPSADLDRIVDLGKQSPSLIMFIIAMFSYIVAFLGRTKSWWPGGLIGAVLGFILFRFNGLVALGLIGLLLDFILSKNYRTWSMEHRTTGWRNTWGGFYNNKPPFKFGGGRSGGGGVSGKW